MVSGFVNREIVMVCDKQKVTTDLKNGTWTFDEAFLQFNRYCIIKNLREKTIKDYQEAYERFVSFLRQYTLLSVVGELARIHIEDYILHLKGTGMKDTSINTYLRGIRVILNFLSEQEASVRIKVPMQKTDKMIKETYTDNELFKLLEKPNISKCEFLEYRNWCIINFLLATGVRISTLINIKISDLDFDFARIHLVYTKSRKSYIIPMSNAIKEVLLEYLSFRMIRK
ncbi:MAG: tyrosine-type recombinase/integrase [Erysipelotrichaceae bacterium]|nr:tyrosine-type recombinase/integrase [Erysipelotrichaceae bacterium]